MSRSRVPASLDSATALDLAAAGCRVTVFDQSEAMSEASRAAAGMLAAADPEIPAELRELSRLSLTLYPEFLARIESLSGKSIPVRTARAAAGRASSPARSQSLSATELQSLAPGVNPGRLLIPASGRAKLRCLGSRGGTARRGACRRHPAARADSGSECSLRKIRRGTRNSRPDLFPPAPSSTPPARGPPTSIHALPVMPAQRPHAHRRASWRRADAMRAAHRRTSTSFPEAETATPSAPR